MTAIIDKMTLKELFSIDISDILQKGYAKGMSSQYEIMDYIIERCKNELDVEVDNYYKLKKLVLNNFSKDPLNEEKIITKIIEKPNIKIIRQMDWKDIKRRYRHIIEHSKIINGETNFKL